MRILVVDDSATMRRIIRNTLKVVGYEDVVEAVDGKMALAKLATESVDFIITDVPAGRLGKSVPARRRPIWFSVKGSDTWKYSVLRLRRGARSRSRK